MGLSLTPNDDGGYDLGGATPPTVAVPDGLWDIDAMRAEAVARCERSKRRIRFGVLAVVGTILVLAWGGTYDNPTTYDLWAVMLPVVAVASVLGILLLSYWADAGRDASFNGLATVEMMQNRVLTGEMTLAQYQLDLQRHLNDEAFKNQMFAMETANLAINVGQYMRLGRLNRTMERMESRGQFGQ